jgi:diacylglycerol kinase family enzyme
MRHAALLYNPLSGRRRRHRVHDVEKAAARLAAAGVLVEVAPTRGAADARGQVEKALHDGCDVIVACGGDGTIHDILQGLVGKPTALGIIPLGTANAMAHDLRLPFDPARAAEVLITAAPRRVAVGRIEYVDFNGFAGSRYFTVGAGAGVDALLFYKLNRPLKGRMGMLAYYAKATHLWLAHRMRYFEAEFSWEGGGPSRETRLSELLAIRINQFGGILRELAPGASLTRNDLRLVLCRTGSRMLYLAYVVRGLLGLRVPVPGIELAYADRVACHPIGSENPESIYVEADGELLGRLPIRLSIMRDSLTLLVPREHPYARSAACAEPEMIPDR